MTKITIGARGSKLSLAYVAKVKELLHIVSEITPDAYVTTEATNPTNISSNNK